MRYRAMAFLITLVLSGLCAAAHAADSVTVRLKWYNQAQFAGFYMAQENGYYKQAGLAVNIQPGGPDFPAIQMVAGGNEQFGVTGADQILIARSKGVPVVALAVIYRRNPFVLFSLKKSGIKTPADWVGKKVGVKIGGNEELIYRAVLAKAKIDKSKLTEIPVKFDMTPLLAGAIDVWPGYLINEVLTAKEKGFGVNIVYPADYGIDIYADTLFTTESMLKNKPNVVRNFVAATLKGWNAAIAAPEEAAKITVKYGDKLTYGHELAMMKASIPLLKPDGQPIGLHGRSRLELRAKASARRRIPEAGGRRHQGLHRPGHGMNAIIKTSRLDAAPLAQSRPVLSIEDLNVRFGNVVAIERLSLTVRRGEFVALLGPSGCGKSTLLKAIARLIKPTGGEIRRPYADLRTGFMFQKPLLLPWRTTLDNVLLPVEIQRGGNIVDSADRRNALRMLELVRLSEFAAAYPHQLSGGMQQRAALARALMCDPDVLLLDEPFGALDELTRDVLNEEMIRIWQSKETRLTTVVMVTHSIPEAVTMSDRVVVLSARPARLIEDVAVTCARPRAPEDPDAGAIIRRIRAMVRSGQ